MERPINSIATHLVFYSMWVKKLHRYRKTRDRWLFRVGLERAVFVFPNRTAAPSGMGSGLIGSSSANSENCPRIVKIVRTLNLREEKNPLCRFFSQANCDSSSRFSPKRTAKTVRTLIAREEKTLRGGFSPKRTVATVRIVPQDSLFYNIF